MSKPTNQEIKPATVMPLLIRSLMHKGIPGSISKMNATEWTVKLVPLAFTGKIASKIIRKSPPISTTTPKVIDVMERTPAVNDLLLTFAVNAFLSKPVHSIIDVMVKLRTISAISLEYSAVLLMLSMINLRFALSSDPVF